MVIILVIGVLLIGAAAGLVARAFLMPRLRTGDALGNISSYGYAGAEPGQRTRPLGFKLNELASYLGELIGGGSAKQDLSLRNQLRAAGLYTLSRRTFTGYRVLLTALLPGLWLWLSLGLDYPTMLVVLGFALAMAVGWVLPMTILRERGRRRLADIEYEMPELIDLLVVTVEAGMGLAGGLQLAGARFGGPLGEELRLTLQEHNLGIAMNEALRNLLDRAGTPSTRSFVRSILQGEQLGVSIGQIMRNLAREMRTRRRQLAEEKAQKAPIKMLFPLIFLIFPAMFVVLLAPSLYAFVDAI